MHILIIILGLFLLLLLFILATRPKKKDTSQAPAIDFSDFLGGLLEGWIAFPSNFGDLRNCSIRIEPLWKEHICLLDVQVLEQATNQAQQCNLVLEQHSSQEASIHKHSHCKNARVYLGEKSIEFSAEVYIPSLQKSYSLQGELHKLDTKLLIGSLQVSRFGFFSSASASVCLMLP